MIRQVLKDKHPEIAIVGTVGPFPSGEDFEKGWAFARELKVPVLDEHYYMSPQWFWDNLSRYEKYDRNGPKVYVGEYAAHDRNRTRNTLRSALAEAAGMTSFERNGDVVKFASYAPLLSRRGHTQWQPDLIYFTASGVYPSINYQVQRLFGRNSGDTLMPAVVEGLQQGDRFAISVVKDSASGDLIIKVVNGEEHGLSGTVTLTPGFAHERHLVATVLTGANPDIANEEDQPPVSMPVSEESNIGAKFERTFPANSLSILRLH
jgi:alpha-L-arabinofuranosidase